MSVARFIADQRTFYRVPYAFCCRLLGVSESWFYKWLDREPTARQKRRERVDAAVKKAFKAGRGPAWLAADPRDLLEAGWTVSVNTVADSMRRQGLVARIIKRTRGLTKQDRSTEVPRPGQTGLHRIRTEHQVGRRHHRDPHPVREAVPGHRDRPVLAASARCGHLAAPERRAGLRRDQDRRRGRGGRRVIEGVIFHSDRGSTYTATDFTKLCRDNGIRQSMGRVGSCFDNAAAEAFFSTLEWEVLSRHKLTDTDQARAVVLDWCYEFYNHTRRHSSANMMSPINYETASVQPDAA